MTTTWTASRPGTHGPAPSGTGGLVVSTHGLVHLPRRGPRRRGPVRVDLVVGAGDGGSPRTLRRRQVHAADPVRRSDAPERGRIRIGDREPSTLGEAELDAFRAAEVGAGPARGGTHLLPYLSAHENVEFAQRPPAGPPPSCAHTGEVLELVGLDTLGPSAAGPARPGQLQLAALGVALASRPGLLGDEPTSQLHHRARDTVLDAMARVNRERGHDHVVVTHDPEVAARLPRTVTIRDGRVGGEGREGRSTPWSRRTVPPPPPAAIGAFPPGALVRVHEVDGVWTLIPLDGGDPA